MPRKIAIRSTDGEMWILEEVTLTNELQLQELVKNNPDLLPIEEVGMAGPLLVVGRETPLPSGSVDMVALARSGELLVVEFKTGPQNPDFRHALAQLVDYGARLWGMTLGEFERAVAARFFASPYCTDTHLRRCTSLQDAACTFWSDLTGEEWARTSERLARQLDTGGLHYVVAAARFTDIFVENVEYLNAQSSQASFYAVEVVLFAGAT